MATSVASATIRYCDRLGNERVAQWGEVAPDELATAMPVRVPPTFAGQRNYPGLFWSVRSQRHLVYESLLELSHLWLLDFASTTAAIATQPFQLTVVDSSHVPDLLVLDTAGGVEVLDVKPAAFRFHPRFRSQVEISERLCTMVGWRYRVATEPDSTVVRNVQFLAVGRRPIAEAIGIEVDDVVAVAAGYSNTIVDNFNLVLHADAQERAFGAPGEPADVSRIVHLADKFISVYEDFMDWAADLRGTSTPAGTSAEAVRLLAKWAEQPVEECRRFITDFVSELDTIEERLKAGEDVRIEATVTLTLDDTLTAAFNEKLREAVLDAD